jgi:hypothetical protein
MKRLALMVGTLLLAAGLAAPPLSATQVGARTRSRHSAPVTLRPTWDKDVGFESVKGVSAGATLFRKQGYLVPNQAAYRRAKAAAATRAGQVQSGPSSNSGVQAAYGDPDVFVEWTGVRDPNVTPPDTTGAIGTSRYIELINDRYAIYNRSGGTMASGSLRGLAKANTDCVTDPQIIWDPQTKRFYYVVLEFSHFLGPGPCGGANPANRLYVGFSRTSSPSNGTTSWCKYSYNYFPEDFDALPDYPKLGDNSAFLLIGSNMFDNSTGGFIGADVAWIKKPGAGSSCPAKPAANHRSGPLFGSDSQPSFTPVPANQTDTSGTGYVVAASSPFFGAANFVDTFPISTNFSNPFGPPVAHNVAAFAFPPNAPQFGTSQLLDTLDARLTQAVSALDPSKNTTAIWTQHTVAGGAGSVVRWYELGAGVNAPLLSGALSDGSLYVFNGAISPDRRVNGSSKLFGDAFIVGFNTSSASDFVRIQMASQWANEPMSNFVEVKPSHAPNEDFSCGAPFPCRWGDYSGATPDPASSPFSNHGQVWLSNQWVATGADTDDVDWRTYNWASHPAPMVILTAPSTLLRKATSFTVSWQLGNLAQAANVRYRQAPWNGPLGPYTPWQNQVPAGDATFSGSTGNTYCFSAEALAPVPNSWGFTPTERCAAVPLDDRDAPLVFSSGWSRLNGSGFFLNTYTKATTKGKSVTVPGAMAKRIYVMVEKCPTCGSIKIYWNSVLQHSYSLFAGSVKKKVYLLAASFGSAQTGNLKIVVSSSGKPVIIDALAVSAV